MKNSRGEKLAIHFEIYELDYILYDKCTLFTDGQKGLVIIQQRYSKRSKCTWWGPIEEEIANDILASGRFPGLFREKARPKDEFGLYPTLALRQALWALKIKGPKKEIWETRF